MDRRQWSKAVVGGLAGLATGSKLGKVFAIKTNQPAVLESLEHIPETKYVKRWEFSDEETAIQFVRSLLPELTRIEIRKDPEYRKTRAIRSGYRGAVRVRLDGEIVSTNWAIYSRMDGWNLILTEDGFWKQGWPLLWDIGVAWAWLAGLRVNGKVVTRDVNWEGKKCFNEYLAQPFRKGDPEIVELTSFFGVDWGFETAKTTKTTA